MKREAFESIELKEMSFLGKKGELVIDRASIILPMNEIVWVRGPSGSGKSVLVKMLCGLLLPNSGEVRINNKVINEMTFEEFLPLRCNMGYSFDFGGLLNNRDIMGNLLLANEYHDYDYGTPDQLIVRITNYMNEFNLKNVAYERPSAIMGGLRKAACVARAFIHEPELLLLDDPTTGLRGDTKNRLKDLILLKKAKGEVKHVFITSEDVEFMKKLNPIIIEVAGGKIQMAKDGAAA
jgi:phospholipid/cholesterol/gamma-HCH transport system ATP-binding protein